MIYLVVLIACILFIGLGAWVYDAPHTFEPW